MKMSEVYKFIRKVFIPIVIPLAICACSVKVAIDANEIAKMQAIITLNSTAPEIDVCENSTEDYGERKRYLDVSVLGGRATNFNIQAIAFIDISPTYYAEKNFDDIVQIPCDYYYRGMSWYGEINDHHYCLWSDCEYDTISNLQDLLDDYYAGSQMGFKIKIHSYVKVGYVNVLGEDEVIYFSVGGFQWQDDRIVEDEYVIDDNIGEAKFEEYDKLLEDDMYLMLYDYDELLDDFLHMVEKSSSQVDSDFKNELYVK